MVSGNKGGVGKSLFCLALASIFDKRNELFSILDGDGRTKDVYSSFIRKIPARWADFRELRPESHNCPQDAVYEAIVHKLLATSTHLIINTPDGADSLLMKWFDMTLKHTESNNCRFRMMYLMSDRPDGLEMLPALSERFSGLYPIRNLHFGTQERFAIFNMDCEPMFHDVLNFPILRGDEVRLLFDGGTYPSEMLREKIRGRYRWPALSRARIRNWLSSVEAAIAPAIDSDEDQSNVIHDL
jgi:hypothetical protein